MNKFTALLSGSLNELRSYSNAVGNIKLAIYTNNAGNPGTLLGSGSSATALASWTAVAINPAVDIVKDTVYWIGFNIDTLDANTHRGLGLGVRTYKAVAYAGYTFPAIWDDTGFSADDTYLHSLFGSINLPVGAAEAGDAVFSTDVKGDYSLKFAATDSSPDMITQVYTRTLTNKKNLSGIDTLSFDIYAERTGENIKIGLHDSGGTTTEITPDVTDADTWQTVEWDISAVADSNKDSINQIIITVVDVDADNTFYIDNFQIAAVGGEATVSNVFGWVA